jgi:hypothetical protein
LYDPLRNRFRFVCPVATVDQERPLSALRSIERLAGAAHPPIYRVAYACAVCGGEHPALLTETELDCEPVTTKSQLVFLNVMTGRREPVARELADQAQRQLRRGNWPWTFYCACEHAVRPGYPSNVARLAATGEGRMIAVAVRCAACEGISINLVSARHLDEPFFHDRVLQFVDRPLPADAGVLARFQDDLWSSGFDRERNTLA